MARSRNIKPGFFKNEHLGDLPAETRLLFIGLWTLADREGRLEDRPKKICAELSPYAPLNVESCLDQLCGNVDPRTGQAWTELPKWDHPFIVRYEVEGKRCIQIVNWEKHQTPHHKEVASNLPPLPEDQNSCLSQAWLKHGSSMAMLGSSMDKKNASCPTDSLLLIPDTLIPDSLNNLPTEDCSELSRGDTSELASPPDEPLSAFQFPTVGKQGRTWTLTAAKLSEYEEAYPTLDVRQEITKARQWCRDNARNRKTPGGMLKFLTGWLNRAQNRGAKSDTKEDHKPRVATREDIENWNFNA